MKIKYCFLFLILSCSFFVALAQKEAAIWIINESGRVLDFNYTPPKLSDRGPLFAPGTGIASISNKKGELLFYGTNIYDSKNSIVSGGSGLTWTGAYASMVIIPAGVQEKTYYLVTPDSRLFDFEKESGPGVQCCFINDTTTCYSIINVDKDKKVSIIKKNIPLLKPGSNVVAATKHANGIDTWLVTTEFNSNKFYAFLFSECGVSDPIISTLNVVPTWPSHALIFSPDGKKLVASLGYNYLMNIDNATGILSNPVKLQRATPVMAFSPDSRYLYFQYTDYPTEDEMTLKYDLLNQTYDSLRIKSSSVPDSGIGSSMSPGIDGKIYFNGGGVRSKLCAIEDPELPLSKSNFQYDLGLVRPLSYTSDFSIFPNFISNYFDPEYASQQADIGIPEIQPPPRICEGDTLKFNVMRTKAVSEYFWDFGDGDTVYNIKAPEHKYSQAGIYTARLIVRYTCSYDTIYTSVIVDNKRNPTEEDTVYSCKIVTLNAGNNYASYLWSNGDTTSNTSVPMPGTYKAELSNACGNYENIYHVISPPDKSYNLITPNGDGRNEVLEFQESPLPLSLSIYNRWGSLIYKTNDYRNNWNAEGESDGLFFYKYNYKDCPIHEGWLQVIR